MQLMSTVKMMDAIDFYCKDDGCNWCLLLRWWNQLMSTEKMMETVDVCTGKIMETIYVYTLKMKEPIEVYCKDDEINWDEWTNWSLV